MSAYKYKINSIQSCHYQLKTGTIAHPYDIKILQQKKCENQNVNLYKIHWVGWKAKFDLWIPEKVINSKVFWVDGKGKVGERLVKKTDKKEGDKKTVKKAEKTPQKPKPKIDKKPTTKTANPPAKTVALPQTDSPSTEKKEKPQFERTQVLSVVKIDKNTFSNLKRKTDISGPSKNAVVSPKMPKKEVKENFIFDGANESSLPGSPLKLTKKSSSGGKVITPDSEKIKARKNVQSVTINFAAAAAAKKMTDKSITPIKIKSLGPKNPLLVKPSSGPIIDPFFNFEIYPSRTYVNNKNNDSSSKNSPPTWISPNLLCLLSKKSDSNIPKKYQNSLAIILSLDKSSTNNNKNNCQLFIPQFQKILPISIDFNTDTIDFKPIRPSRSEQQVQTLKNDDHRNKTGWIVSVNKAHEDVDAYTAVVKINQGPVKIYQLADLALVMDWKKICFEM